MRENLAAAILANDDDDVRDLARFLVHCAEQRHTGAFNAFDPPRPLVEFLEATRDAVNPDARLTWVPASFLFEHDWRISWQFQPVVPMWRLPLYALKTHQG